MSKLSNTKRGIEWSSPFYAKIAKAVEATDCEINDADFIEWGGLSIGIVTSRGDWTTGEVTDYVMISIRGLPIEKELMAHFTLHDIPFITHDRRRG